MSSLDSTTSTTNNPTNPTSTIIFECSDIRRDTGLLLLKRKDPDKFEIHLYNDYTSDAIAMVLSIKIWKKCLSL